MPLERSTRWISAFAVGTQPIERIPQSDGSPAGLASGPSGALIGGILRDAFGGQAIDAAVRIISGDLVKTAVDDSPHAGNRDRRFRDVGRHDDPSRRAVAGSKRAILLVCTEPAVERQHVELRCVQPGPQLGDRRANLSGARQEAQHVAVRGASQRFGALDERPGRCVGDLERVGPARRCDGPDSLREIATPTRRRASPTSPRGAGPIGRATPVSPGRWPGRRADCVRGIRRERWCGIQRGADRLAVSPSGCLR